MFYAMQVGTPDLEVGCSRRSRFSVGLQGGDGVAFGQLRARNVASPTPGF